MIAAKVIKERFRYSPLTGRLVERYNTTHHKAGQSVTRLHSGGYLVVTVDRNQKMAHVVAWICATGRVPPGRITFANGDKTDLRWSNLMLKSESSDLSRNKRSNAVSQLLQSWRLPVVN